MRKFSDMPPDPQPKLMPEGFDFVQFEEELRKRFADAGALTSDRVITYCGGAIAASQTALLLTLLGKENVAVYNGSMVEWGADPNLPLVTGAAT